MKSILIAEDDTFLANAYRVKFQKAGYDVTIAPDGVEAISQLKLKLYDVILLDLVMPNKDGFTTLEEIRKNTSWAKIPIIVASNLGQEEDVKKAKELGADDYVIKSDTPIGDIVKKVEQYGTR